MVFGFGLLSSVVIWVVLGWAVVCAVILEVNLSCRGLLLLGLIKLLGFGV